MPTPRTSFRGARSSLVSGLVLALVGALLFAVAPSFGPSRADAAAPQRLTNLDHLDFLGDRVSPPKQVRHTTYRLAQEPEIGTLWTYADRNDDGSYRRIGGGDHDAATDTYTQGAFNADDMARAAVVYLRDWKQTGHRSSRTAAYEMLRGLAYLQTTSGKYAGNVVLWMQPDGTLNRSAKPAEEPDPSDSDASYWLSRTIWALGEAYPAFRHTDPAFARFVKQRLDLGIAALDRQVLDEYGQYMNIDGRRTPRWLVNDGADASAEAVLGLASYVRVGGTAEARHVLRQLSVGIADLAGGDAKRWPFGGVLPWALSRSDWHAWSSQMPAALALASDALGDSSLGRVADRDSFTFNPWMLTSGGPDNGRLPTRLDANQMAYGVDSRVQSLIAGHTAGGDRLAGFTAAWFFGANAARVATYDPATGVTFDGVAPDGTVNHNSGAESTIHGLLTMLALDAHPDAARIARTAEITETEGVQTVQAEDATLAGGASAVKLADLWTGESQFGGSGYASLPDGSSATFDLGDHPAALVMPVVDLQRGSSAVTSFRSGGTVLGSVRAGAVGPQGASPAPGALLPRTLGATLPVGSSALTVTTTATEDDATRLDAVVVQPLVTRLVLGGDGHGTALLRNASTRARRAEVEVPGSGRAAVWAYDGLGRLGAHHTDSGSTIGVEVPPGGFVLARR